MAGRHHPEEQGLKLSVGNGQPAFSHHAGRHHPEEQGLKPCIKFGYLGPLLAGRHHPEEQGLKPKCIDCDPAAGSTPVGIIQKNKD